MKIAAAVLATSPLLLAFAAAGNVAGSTDPLWAYHEDKPTMVGPSKWYTINEACRGTKQSPINIAGNVTQRACSDSLRGAQAKTQLPLVLSGSCEDFELEAGVHDFEAKPKDGDCTVTSHGSVLPFAQLHFHLPSEHKIDGKQADGELHFVHKTDKGAAVIALLLESKPKAKTPEFLIKFWDGLTHTTHDEPVESELGDFHELVRDRLKKRGVFNYAGSLTTPPCTEFVDWWVVRKPIAVAPEDLEKARNVQRTIATNVDGLSARPIQETNARKVTLYN